MDEQYNPQKRETYEEDVEELVSFLTETYASVLLYLLSLDLHNLNGTDQRKVEKKVRELLNEGDQKSHKWTDKTISKAFQTGAAQTLATLGYAIDTKAAMQEVKMDNRLNKQVVNAIKRVTYNDLLKLTHNTDQRVKDIITRIVMENMKDSELGTAAKTFRKKIIADLREEIKGFPDFAVIDRGNKPWTVEQYARMIARTKIMQAHIEGTVTESLRRDAVYGVISTHGSKHASCRRWEGRIVRLTEEASGDFPLLSDLRTYGSGIFHPHCKHFVHPVRSLDILPDSIIDNSE